MGQLPLAMRDSDHGADKTHDCYLHAVKHLIERGIRAVNNQQ